MGMFVYKMFAPGLVCRGYQFKEGVNECDRATCVKEGFHAAENPLDCLSYYPNFDESECWLCYADGDIHEDGSDSKISCTKLEILKRLSKYEFVKAALEYIAQHPKRELNHCIEQDRAEADSNGIAIAIGDDPYCKGNKAGDLLAWILMDGGNIFRIRLSTVGVNGLFPGKWYNICGREVSVCD